MRKVHVALTAQNSETFAASNEIYGVPSICAELQGECIVGSRNRTAHLMQERRCTVAAGAQLA